MTKTLLDTHAVLWLTQSEKALGARARAACEEALAADELAISPVTYYELADLVGKRRLTQHVEMSTWRRNVLAKGVLEWSVSGTIAVQASELVDFHKDPWDRFIVATSLVYEARLITADRQILDWTGALDRIDARK